MSIPNFFIWYYNLPVVTGKPVFGKILAKIKPWSILDTHNNYTV
jgi:heme/copper-type cytochrome/quinol oxidase subunit 1